MSRSTSSSQALKKEIKFLKSQNKILKSQKSFAWANYYKTIELHHNSKKIYATMIDQINNEVKEIPVHIVNELQSMSVELKKELDCPICLNSIAVGKLKITGCGHKYCEDCYKEINKCAICRRKIKK